MKIVMDADCLIKLTKAGLKEVVCAALQVAIPAAVRREVVDDAPGHPDAGRIGENLKRGLLAESGSGRVKEAGEEAALALYRAGRFAAVASDDRRFLWRLRQDQVPFLTPATILVLLLRRKKLDLAQARAGLKALAPYVSDEERATAQIVLDNWRRP